MSMMDAPLYRPAEAASLLGIPSSTLRLYSVRFGPLLSEGAARPRERGGGKPGFRVYTEEDLDVLREGKGLLERGLTYEEALVQLRRRWMRRASRPVEDGVSLPPSSTPGSEEEERGARAAWPGLEQGAREAEWMALVGSLMTNLGSAQALAEEWRQVAKERSEEVAELRERIRTLEERRRRPWWARLFGGG